MGGGGGGGRLVVPNPVGLPINKQLNKSNCKRKRSSITFRNLLINVLTTMTIVSQSADSVTDSSLDVLYSSWVSVIVAKLRWPI